MWRVNTVAATPFLRKLSAAALAVFAWPSYAQGVHFYVADDEDPRIGKIWATEAASVQASQGVDIRVLEGEGWLACSVPPGTDLGYLQTVRKDPLTFEVVVLDGEAAGCQGFLSKRTQ
jgi:hypothetical protein